MWIDYIGLLAAFLTTLAFLPQAIKTLRTRDTSGISLIMYLVLETGVVMWFFYGWYKDLTPVWLANLVTAILAGIILWMKIREKPGTPITPDSPPL